MYRQVGGDGCVDVAQGYWRIYRFGGDFNVIWNFCETGLLRPPVTGWRLGRGYFSDTLDSSTRINTMADQVKEEKEYFEAGDAVEEMNNFMIGKIITKIDEFNVAF